MLVDFEQEAFPCTTTTIWLKTENMAAPETARLVVDTLSMHTPVVIEPRHFDEEVYLHPGERITLYYRGVEVTYDWVQEDYLICGMYNDTISKHYLSRIHMVLKGFPPRTHGDTSYETVPYDSVLLPPSKGSLLVHTQGRVVDTDSTEISGVHIQAPLGPQDTAADTSDHNGGFSLPVKPGFYGENAVSLQMQLTFAGTHEQEEYEITKTFGVANDLGDIVIMPTAVKEPALSRAAADGKMHIELAGVNVHHRGVAISVYLALPHRRGVTVTMYRPNGDVVGAKRVRTLGRGTYTVRMPAGNALGSGQYVITVSDGDAVLYTQRTQVVR
jgi:hypothetical protein